MNLSVSALSRRVQKLEQHLGKTLFSRHGNEYQLNIKGRQLFEKIEVPFTQIADALEDRDTADSKKLAVGVPTSFATAWLIPRLASFREENPGIELQFDTSGSPIEKLGKTLDVIIFFAQEGDDAVKFEPLRPQGAFTVAQEGVADPLLGLKANLGQTPVLVHRRLPQILSSWIDAMGLPQDFPLTIETFDDGPLLIAAAQSGLGIALVLEDMVNFYGNVPGLRRPFGEYVPTPFSYAIAAKPASASVQVIEQFRTWIRREAAKDSEARMPKEKLEAG